MHNWAKLSAAEVAIIRLLSARRNPYVAPPKHVELARRFGITAPYVGRLTTTPSAPGARHGPRHSVCGVATA